MGSSVREAILAAARRSGQARGYGGLNFRDLAKDVGIKAASIHYYFPSKADLGAAVARRYWEDTAEVLEAMAVQTPDPLQCLRRYPEIFRKALESNNRMCLCSCMAAEFDELPEAVRKEIHAFVEVNVTWLTRLLSASSGADANQRDSRARAIFAAVAGAQLMARTRADVAYYDSLLDSYRLAGLLPA